MRKGFLAAIGFVLPLVSLTARATPITAGSTQAASVLTVGPGATLLATASGTISPGTFTGTYTESVYADPTNEFGTGDLDFVYKFNDTGSSGVIERGTGYSFDTTILTDAGYTPGTGKAPTSVDRSANGNVVGFNFLGVGEIDAGQSSDTLIIETNATNYMPGLVSLQDGSAGTGNGLAPAMPLAATPEPSSIVLLGTGLLGLAGLVKRRIA